MKLLLLIVGFLPFFVTCCSFQTCCPTETVRLLLDSDVNGVKYSRDCQEVSSVEYLAVCIAQRTSLQTILGCANVKKGWIVYVPRGSRLDNDLSGGGGQKQGLQFDNDNDLLPTFLSSSSHGKLALDSFNIENDGSVIISARSVLQNVAHFCRHRGTVWDLQYIFDLCPFGDTQLFLSCLCIHKVQDHHIRELHKCLVNAGSAFAEPRALPLSLEKWMCRATRTELVHSGSCPLPGSSYHIDEKTKRRACTTRWLAGVQKPLPRPPIRVRAHDDDYDKKDHYEIDESEVDQSQFSDFPDFTFTYNTPLPTVPLSTRTTPASSFATSDLPSGFAEVEPSGTPTHFAEPAPDNAGAGFKAANHALLGSMLAFMGVLYHVA